MLGLLDIEIPVGKYSPFALNGIRVLGLPHDPAAACYLIIDLQTGPLLDQTPTGPDMAV